MRLTSVVLTSWISSITSKISWIVGWSWSNHVCVCVSVRLCLSVINSTNWYMGRKNKYCFFCLEIWILAWRSHGKIMELFSEIFVGTLNTVWANGTKFEFVKDISWRLMSWFWNHMKALQMHTGSVISPRGPQRGRNLVWYPIYVGKYWADFRAYNTSRLYDDIQHHISFYPWSWHNILLVFVVFRMKSFIHSQT